MLNEGLLYLFVKHDWDYYFLVKCHLRFYLFMIRQFSFGNKSDFGIKYNTRTKDLL